DRLLDRQNRRRWHLFLLHMLNGAVSIRKCGQPFLDQLDQLWPVGEAGRVRRESRITHQVGPVHRGAKVLPMMEEGHDDDPSAVRFEDSGRGDVGKVRPLTGRLDLSVAAAVLVDADLVTVEVDVEQSDVEVLSPSRTVAMAECREDREGAVDSRVYVTNCGQRYVRSATGLADHGSDPGVSLRDEIVA